MRRSEHRTRAPDRASGEVELIGGRQPQVQNVKALAHHTLAERRGQCRGGRAHVVADRNGGLPFLAQDGGKCCAGIEDKGLIQHGIRVRLHDAADVIGFHRRLHDSTVTSTGRRILSWLIHAH